MCENALSGCLDYEEPVSNILAHPSFLSTIDFVKYAQELDTLKNEVFFTYLIPIIERELCNGLNDPRISKECRYLNEEERFRGFLKMDSISFFCGMFVKLQVKKVYAKNLVCEIIKPRIEIKAIILIEDIYNSLAMEKKNLTNFIREGEVLYGRILGYSCKDNFEIKAAAKDKALEITNENLHSALPLWQGKQKYFRFS